MGLTWLLVYGIKESARANDSMVLVKIAAILVFILGAARAIQPDNYRPFMPNGFTGVLTGAAIVFFTYIGFDSVSTAAEECKNPQRDLPIGILGTLVVCGLLYVGVAVVLTGIARWDTLNNAAPIVGALKNLGMNTLWKWIDIGALGGMVSSLLVFQFGQARVWFAMSRDGLLPSFFSKIRLHLDRRLRRRHPLRRVGRGHLRRPLFHRHAVRLLRRLGGRADPAPHPPGARGRLPGALRPGIPLALHAHLPGADDGAAAGDLGALRGLVRRRHRDLLRLREEAQCPGALASPC
jgi:hypothetical protein